MWKLSSIFFITFVFFPSNSSAFVVDSYDFSNGNGENCINKSDDTGTNMIGQSFTASDSGTLASVSMQIRKQFSDSTGDFVYAIYSHTGVYGTSSVPTGSRLASSSLGDIDILPTSLTTVSLIFTGDNAISLVSGNKYVLVVDTFNHAGDKGPCVGADNSSPTHGGNYSQRETTSWVAYNGVDETFKIVADIVSSPTGTSSISYYDGLASSHIIFRSFILIIIGFSFPLWYFNKKRNDKLI